MSNRLAEIHKTQLKGTGLLVTPKRSHHRTRRESFRCALQGLHECWTSQPNLRLQVLIAICVAALGAWYRLSVHEWLWISFAIGLVIVAELMNTAIEQTIDLAAGLSPDPVVRRAKDIAAGCVFIACLLAVVIGVLTFFPHLLTG